MRTVAEDRRGEVKADRIECASAAVSEKGVVVRESAKMQPGTAKRTALRRKRHGKI